MIRVLIVDDHMIVRQGLREILSEIRDVDFIGEASTDEETMAMLSQKPGFDIILLDVSLKTGNGIDLLRQIRKKYPKQKVLMLSMYPEDSYALAALRTGASGYLSKDCSTEELITAIARIIEKGRYISESLAEILAESASRPPEKKPHELLSEREYQTFLMMAAGKSVVEIAEEMSLSSKTVSVYRSRLLDKMQLRNTAELVHYALRHHLFDIQQEI